MTGSVGADVCGRPLAERPWRADDRVQVSSDAGPQLDGVALEIDTSLLTREGHWRIADDMDAVVLDSSSLVVAYLTGVRSNESVVRLSNGALVPCEPADDMLLPGTYALVGALEFVEVKKLRHLR